MPFGSLSRLRFSSLGQKLKMSASRREREPRNAFWALGGMSVSDVGSKITSKEVIKSSPFVSRQDPRPATFRLLIGFGQTSARGSSAHIYSADRKVAVGRIRISVCDNKGKVLHKAEGKEVRVLERGDTYGWYDFHKVADAAVKILRFIAEVEYCAPPVAKPAINSSLQNDYLRLLETADNADVTFSLNGGRIKAHKSILSARSTYFSKMFGSNMKESVSDEVEVPDASPEVFGAMLQFLYGGYVPKNLDDVATDLVVIAEKYGMSKLKKICESRICANLNADTVVDALLLAERHDCKDLMLQAKAVFRVNAGAVKKSNGEKLKENPDFLYELLVHFCSD